MNSGLLLVAVRLRGPSENSRETEHTLRLLNLTRANWATLLPNTPSVVGMLRKVSMYVCWGEADAGILVRLLERAQAWGGAEREEALKALGVENVSTLADKLLRGEVSLKDLKSVFKPRFRLHPPKGDLRRSIKRQYKQRGETGYVGREIEQLVSLMC